MNTLYALLVGYLFGSIPFAVFIAKARGVDIFKVGSGNPGATNVKRSVGKMEGNLCFVLDALKGFVPVLIGLLCFKESGAACAALFGALLGHSFSVWIGFKGGKGVATTIGGLLALMPLAMVAGLLIWVGVFYSSRYVSLASILMAAWFPFGAWVFGYPLPTVVVATIVGALVIVRHKANIERLVKGTENRFSKEKK